MENKFLEGQEFTLSDPDGWSILAPKAGDVLCTELLSSSMEVSQEVWVPFLIMWAIVNIDGSISAQAKSLGGSESEELNKILSNTFNRRPGFLHLCSAPDCGFPGKGLLHIVRARWFTLEGFSSFMSPASLRQAKKWLETAGSPPEMDPAEEAERWAAMTRQMGEELAKQGVGQEPPDDGGGAPVKPGSGGLDPAKVEALRKRLSEEKERFLARGGDGHGEVPTGTGGVDGAPPNEKPDKKGEESDSAQSDSSKSKKRKKKKKKKEKKEREVNRGKSQSGKEKKDGKEKKGANEKERQSAALGALTTGTMMGPSSPTLTKGASNDGTSRSYAEQLAMQARTHAVTKSGQVPTGTGKPSVAAALTQAVSNQLGAATVQKKANKSKKKGSPSSSPSSSSSSSSSSTPRRRGGGKKKKKKDSKKKKKAKKRKKMRKALKSGKTAGSSSSSSNTSGTKEESSSELELEAPLRKKAKEAPGSVLAMLVAHVRNQLEQGSLVDVKASSSGDITGGIRMTTYLNLHVKPAYGTHLRELRELHLLAVSLDALRKGELDHLGDTLAGRFIAIHQSLLDGSWAGAKWLEVEPLADGAALGEALLLKARRHQKLIQKVQGTDQGWGSGRGRGKGGKQATWQSWTQDGETWKGAKGKDKGKKSGKKGKSSRGGDPSWQKSADWKETQDKGDK